MCVMEGIFKGIFHTFGAFISVKLCVSAQLLGVTHRPQCEQVFIENICVSTVMQRVVSVVTVK